MGRRIRRGAGRSVAAAGLVALAVALAPSGSSALAPAADAGSPRATAPASLAGRGPEAWREAGRGGVRGVTVGPIENAYHPGLGYGSAAYGRMLAECKQWGATWIAITPFGRVADLAGRGVDPTFEKPHLDNQSDVRRAVAMAHAAGLSVMLVPHLWVESGQWRAEIDPKTDEGWARWAESYRSFVLGWARVAEEAGVEMLSAGVELRSWVTTTRAPTFAAVLRDVRKTYHGLLTYSANWDDVEHTVILSELDVIGINAFYPLADKEGAGFSTLLEGGERVQKRVSALARAWQKPVLFTEIGYTTRPDPAVKPWEWPDAMKNVVVDELAQAHAYRALVAPLLDEPSFMGFFVWRVYADPDDVSQEAEWGFSPRGKLAELVVRDAFLARWAVDGDARPRFGRRARVPSVFP
jgi:hypothetical protein